MGLAMGAGHSGDSGSGRRGEGWGRAAPDRQRPAHVQAAVRARVPGAGDPSTAKSTELGPEKAVPWSQWPGSEDLAPRWAESDASISAGCRGLPSLPTASCLSLPHAIPRAKAASHAGHAQEDTEQLRDSGVLHPTPEPKPALGHSQKSLLADPQTMDMCVRAHTCKYTDPYTQVSAHVCTHMYIWIRTHVYSHGLVHTYAYMGWFTHVCIHG